MRDREFRDVVGDRVTEQIMYEDIQKVFSAVLNHLAFHDEPQGCIVSVGVAKILRAEYDWNDDEIQLFETFVRALQQ